MSTVGAHHDVVQAVPVGVPDPGGTVAEKFAGVFPALLPKGRTGWALGAAGVEIYFPAVFAARAPEILRRGDEVVPAVAVHVAGHAKAVPVFVADVFTLGTP